MIVVTRLNGQTGAQTGGKDPYNPQTQRAVVANPPETPTLADLGTGTDQGSIGPFVTNTDKQYAQAMASRGIMEIRLGQTALDKTEREDVKQVARRLIADYLSWNEGMAKAAKKLEITLPSELSGKEKAELDRISALSGPAFDQAYLKEVIRLQTKALSMSHHEASDAAGVSGFRFWAGVVVPKILEEVHMAEAALKAQTAVSRK